jgi:hypothetical protein
LGQREILHLGEQLAAASLPTTPWLPNPNSASAPLQIEALLPSPGFRVRIAIVCEHVRPSFARRRLKEWLDLSAEHLGLWIERRQKDLEDQGGVRREESQGQCQSLNAVSVSLVPGARAMTDSSKQLRVQVGVEVMHAGNWVSQRCRPFKDGGTYHLAHRRRRPNLLSAGPAR